MSLWQSNHQFLAVVATPVPLMALAQWWSLRRNTITVRTAVTRPSGEEIKTVQVVPLATADAMVWIALVASLFMYALAELI